MTNKYFNKVLNKEYVIFLHNGYSEFSYGIALNPIELSLEEYNVFVEAIDKLGLGKCLVEFENSQNFDFKIPFCLADKIGFSILTLSPPECRCYDLANQKTLNDKKNDVLTKLRDIM